MKTEMRAWTIFAFYCRKKRRCFSVTSSGPPQTYKHIRKRQRPNECVLDLLCLLRFSKWWFEDVTTVRTSSAGGIPAEDYVKTKWLYSLTPILFGENELKHTKVAHFLIADITALLQNVPWSKENANSSLGIEELTMFLILKVIFWISNVTAHIFSILRKGHHRLSVHQNRSAASMVFMPVIKQCQVSSIDSQITRCAAVKTSCYFRAF